MVARFDLDRPKLTVDTPDDEFGSTTLDPKWTAVAGTTGTVDLTATTGGVYDLSSRSGWLLAQAAFGADVKLRQDYTLPDGASIVVAMSPALTAVGQSSIGDNDLDVGITLNTDDASEAHTTGVTIHLDSEIEGWRLWSGGSGSSGSSLLVNRPHPFLVAERVYLRILRDGLVYYPSWSSDGATWFPFAPVTLAAEATNIWLFAAVSTSLAPALQPIQAFDWIRQGGAGVDPWDPQAAESVIAAARGGVITGGRAAVTITRPVTPRGGVIVGGRATLTVSPDEVNPAARGGVIVGGRATLTPTRTPDARGGVVVGGRATVTRVTDGLLTPRGGVIVGGRATLTVTRIVKARGGVIVGGAVATPQVTRTVKARGGVIVGGRDAYVGPGTGIVVQGFVDPLSVLREGDTFNVFLPWAGLQGMSGLAHVISRSVSDDREDQQIELSIVPSDDTSRVPQLAGGATPTPQADSTDVARKQSQQSREIDRIERNRRNR